MSEIANCPTCGKKPTKMTFGAGWAQDGYRCCGHTADMLILWNQYTAAMELAMATKKRKQAHDYVREAWKVSDEVSDLAREALEDADGEVKEAQNKLLAGTVRMLIGCIEDTKKYPDMHDDFVEELEAAREALAKLEEK